MRTYYVYIMASASNGTLYVGVTNDLQRRIQEHKEGSADGFTKEHGIKMLVYYEATNDALSAIEREKRLKKWNRLWKLRTIEEQNPDWKDLSLEL